MLPSKCIDKKQSEQPMESKDEKHNEYESQGDQYQEVLISGDDRRKRIDAFKHSNDDIYPCIGQLDVEYHYPHHNFNKSIIGTATVIFVANSNTENEEKEEKEEKAQGIILTCTHNVRLTVMQCNECNNYRLKKDKNGHYTECLICLSNNNHPTSKQITIKATKITFRDRSIAHNNYGETIDNYKCKEYYVPDNEYKSSPVPKGGYDWAFLRFTDKNNTYKERLQSINIQLVNGLDEFSNDEKRDYALFGYPGDHEHKDIMLGMFSDNVNEFVIKTNMNSNNIKYLQQTAIDTGYGQSGSLIWFKENNIVKVCGIHCGGSQGTQRVSYPHNIATIIDEKIIDKYYSLIIRNGWKVTFSIKSRIIRKEQELKLFEKMLWKQLNVSNNINLKLLYRSREQNYDKDATAFHSACDGKEGGTITIIQSEYKHIFGGYTSIPWSSPNNLKWIFDTAAFLYLLSSPLNDVKVYPIGENNDKSIAHNKLNGPCFGRRDIIIKGSESFCFSNNAYKISGNHLCGGNSIIETQSEIKFAFKYTCYEVYLLKKN